MLRPLHPGPTGIWRHAARLDADHAVLHVATELPMADRSPVAPSLSQRLPRGGGRPAGAPAGGAATR